MRLLKTNIALFLLLALFTLSSCGSAKMGKHMSAHKLMFADALSGQLTEEQKLDVIGNSLATALEEALSYGTLKKSVKHMNRFSKDNEKSLNLLIKDVNTWIGGMQPAEKMMMIPKVASKDYARKLIDLVPKFERKVNRRIQTFKIASKVIGAVTPKF